MLVDCRYSSWRHLQTETIIIYGFMTLRGKRRKDVKSDKQVQYETAFETVKGGERNDCK